MTWTAPTDAERESHLRALALRALAEIAEHGELDFKRPLGNSDIAGDVLEAIGVPPAGREADWPSFTDAQAEYAWALWEQWPKWAAAQIKRDSK